MSKVRCPHCGAAVVAGIGPDGGPRCPLCHNQGNLGTVEKPNAPGAVASLVCGIVGAVTGFFGLILGIIAIVLASNARQAMEQAPGQYGGKGLADAGRILGIVAICLSALTVVVAALMFGLASILSSP